MWTHQLSLSWYFGGFRVAHLICFCVVLLCVLVLCCDVRYDFLIENDVRFVFTSSYL
jgi:hypothetical protein